VTDSTRPKFPVRDPAPGPAVILDLPRLWVQVEDEMLRRGMTRKNGDPELKQLADLTGLDRNTLGRTRAAARNNKIVEGQRGGLNVNAYLTLVSFTQNGRAAAFGRELRGGVPPYTASIEPVPAEGVAAEMDAPSDVTFFGDSDYRSGALGDHPDSPQPAWAADLKARVDARENEDTSHDIGVTDEDVFDSPRDADGSHLDTFDGHRDDTATGGTSAAE
jgi:hypothetical protein